MLGAVLAFVALFGLFAIAGWHNSVVHDDDVQIVAVDHGHTPSKEIDHDAPIHLLAHATGQWIGFADPIVPVAPMVTNLRVWAADIAPWRHGITPTELLRPPRD